MNGIRISAPDTARQGDIIELKAMIQHEMESGFRRDAYGKPIPRDILTKFECLYDGEVVLPPTSTRGIGQPVSHLPYARHPFRNA